MNDLMFPASMKRETIDSLERVEHQRGFIGSFYIRPMALAPGQRHDGHAHWIDHVSNIIKPPILIKLWNPNTDEHEEKTILVPCKIVIKAEWWHQFIAIGEDGCEWECWFSKHEAEAKYDKPVPWPMEVKSGNWFGELNLVLEKQNG